ncbi:MAG TPA: hypothetical protein VG796_25455 [Verrucomicrobiales bacterium]|nr:hypothetical protein [Verrucomicrobiales bacterium]
MRRAFSAQKSLPMAVPGVETPGFDDTCHWHAGAISHPQRNGGDVADGFVLLALDKDHDIGGG